jgi:hypothetical protein
MFVEFMSHDPRQNPLRGAHCRQQQTCGYLKVWICEDAFAMMAWLQLHGAYIMLFST